MIHLNNIVPTPLASLGLNPNSQIFNVEQVFEKGKNYLVKAPSGKGKSTLLHIIYGLRNDFTGNLKLSGEDSTQFLAEVWADWRQSKLSIVFQDLRLFEQLTAFENIWLKAQLRSNKTESDIYLMADQLGIGHLMDKAASTLSYGQRQRVAIIRALCQPFECLLLDEPFSHLDEENTKKALALIDNTCRQQGAGMILVSLGEDFPLEFDAVLEL